MTTTFTPETLRQAAVIADKIEDGTLFRSRVCRRAEHAETVRAVIRELQRLEAARLTLIDQQTHIALRNVELQAEADRLRAELQARNPLPLSDDDQLRLRSDVARAIWEVMREHEDRCDHALEDVHPKHQVWDCADAAIETAIGIVPRLNPLIARREIVADGPVRVTRLHLTDEGRAALTSKATGPLPGAAGGSS